MQLLGVKKDEFYRNRLTHSLEVSQIARGIAEVIRESSECEGFYNEDMYVVEAASLAHDIGNPPFGHHGERVLNNIMKDYGGFEGNAQTLRVLNKLEKKLPNKEGLNLSKRTLLSVVKYFSKNDKKKFIYDADYEIINNICEENEITLRTVDVQIMDLADEIAYGAHDLEDALSLNMFNIDEFLYEFERHASHHSFETLKKLVDNAKEVANKASVYGSSEEYGFLFRKELISNIVHTLIIDIGVVAVSDNDRQKTGTQNTHELGFKNYRNLADKLKILTFGSINRNNSVQMYERQGEKIIKGLFKAFTDENFNRDNILLPIEYRKKDGVEKYRAITDYIAGMMDSFAIKTYEGIYGSNNLHKIYNENDFENFML